MRLLLQTLLIGVSVTGCIESPPVKSELSETLDVRDKVTRIKVIADAIKIENLGKKVINDEILYFDSSGQNFSGWAKGMYENGQIKTLVEFKEGKLSGISLEWYENGVENSEYNWIAGKQVGRQREWYRNGQISLEGNFSGGKLFSAQAWKPDGEKCGQTKIEDGEGVLVYYDPNGNERLRQFFGPKDEAPAEKAEIIGKDLGNLIMPIAFEDTPVLQKPIEEKQTSLSLPKKDVSSDAPKIELGSYSKTQGQEIEGEFGLSLEWVRLALQGSLPVEEVKPATGQGQRMVYYKDLEGNRVNGWMSKRVKGKVVMLSRFENGLPEGKNIAYSQSGRVSSVMDFVDGNALGPYRFLHPNGMLAVEGAFKGGEPDGIEEKWHPNGMKQATCNYSNGLPNGLIMEWYENGQKRVHGTFRNGKFLTGKGWKPNGGKCPVSEVSEGNGLFVRYHMDGSVSSRHRYLNGEQMN